MNHLTELAREVIARHVARYGHTLTEQGIEDLTARLIVHIDEAAEHYGESLVADADCEHGAFLCARCMETHPLEDGETLAPEAGPTLYCPDCIDDERADVQDSWEL